MLAKASKKASGWPDGSRHAARARVVRERGVGIAGVESVRLAVVADEHLVRLLLVPLEAAERAVDLDAQVVLPAVADLRGGHGAERPVLVADHGVAVVVERTGPARRS